MPGDCHFFFTGPNGKAQIASSMFSYAKSLREKKDVLELPEIKGA